MEKNQDKPNGYLSQDDLSQDDLLSGYEGLVIAILKLMMKDLTIPESEIEVRPRDRREVKRRKKRKKYYKRSAYRFLMSEWFDDLCWGMGANPHPIRQYAIECYNESKKK